MTPLKIEKTVVEAKSRTLKATWTIDIAQDLKSDHNVDIEDELAKMLAEEIRREQLKEMCERLSWTRVVVNTWQQISNDWCKKYIKHRYQHLGNTWYFEDDRDATLFTLKWSTSVDTK
jgi:hypothetical protein